MAMTSVRQSFPCGNLPCPSKPKFVCPGCLLLGYCSKSCRDAHQAEHEQVCKSDYMKDDWTPLWYAQGRVPAFAIDSNPATSYGARKYLWGNVPAIDILALKDNEGESYSKDLELLFAASGDIRNVVKTIVKLPKTFRQGLTITINDYDLDIVARNVIMLVILLAAEDIEAAIDCVLHIWYSAQITQAHQDMLDDLVRPLFNEMCEKLADNTASTLKARMWTWGNRSMRLVLPKEAWICAMQYLDVPLGLTSQRARQLRTDVTLAVHRTDYCDRHYYSLPKVERVCSQKFREDGILLPFSHSRDAHNIPNPTFFQNRDTWPMMDSADPIDGWDKEKVLKTDIGALKNDLYGKLYYYIKQHLLLFCQRLRDAPHISFNLFNLDARELHGFEKDFQPGSYDRIEISNISDQPYLGTALALKLFTPLLRDPKANKHATLLTLFMNAVQTEFDRCGDSSDLAIFQREFGPVSTFFPGINIFDRFAPETVKMYQALPFGRNVEKYMRDYLRHMQSRKIAKEAGAWEKDMNTIVEKWPGRLKLQPHQKGAKEEFDRVMATNRGGMDCYIEWRRVEADKTAAPSSVGDTSDKMERLSVSDSPAS